MRSVSSIEPDGMKNACTRNVRISTARQNATTSSSGSSCHSGMIRRRPSVPADAALGQLLEPLLGEVLGEILPRRPLDARMPAAPGTGSDGLRGTPPCREPAACAVPRAAGTRLDADADALPTRSRARFPTARRAAIWGPAA